MITLERNNLSSDVVFNTWRSDKGVEDFINKWKHLDFIVYTEAPEKPIEIKYLNMDWKDTILHVSIKDQGTFNIRQFPGLCGVAIVYDCLNLLKVPELKEFIEELLLRMNYTVMMISNVTYTVSQEDNNTAPVKREYQGFEALMELNNRRTTNYVTIFYKQLIWK